jgi:hypothetical protein
MKMHPTKFVLAPFYTLILFSRLVGIWKLKGFGMRTLQQTSFASGDVVGMIEIWTNECSE